MMIFPRILYISFIYHLVQAYCSSLLHDLYNLLFTVFEYFASFKAPGEVFMNMQPVQFQSKCFQERSNVGITMIFVFKFIYYISCYHGAFSQRRSGTDKLCRLLQ
ncbi:hypothetical protein AgCh_035521 [Apium graveolens]